jgi:hypothetical protein
MRNKKVAYISYGHKREIWGKDATNTLILLDTIDLNHSDVRKVVKESQKLIKHPWFVYFGGQGNFNSETFNLMLSVRIGFFLLKDCWDLALSETFSASEIGTTSELGILSKVYYPIRKYKISPYIGAGLSFVYTGYDNGQEGLDFDYIEDTYWNSTLLLGVNWYIAPGSLDIGIQYGKVSKFAITIGYTFFPWGN